jgi:hypothetical protein
MSKHKANIQVKINLDDNIKGIWDFLKSSYPTLDNASIFRLALATLGETTKKNKLLQNLSINEILDEAANDPNADMSEEDVARWWNENKRYL